MWCSSVDLTRYTSVCNSGSDLELRKTQTITFNILSHFVSQHKQFLSNIPYNCVGLSVVVVVGLSRCAGLGMDLIWVTVLSAGWQVVSLLSSLPVDVACSGLWTQSAQLAQPPTQLDTVLLNTHQWNLGLASILSELPGHWLTGCAVMQSAVLDWFQENCSAPTKSSQVGNKVWGWALYFGSVLSFNCGNIMVLKFYSAEPW